MATMSGAFYPHGKRSSYNNGCRCKACRAANAEYFKSRRTASSGNDPEEPVDASRAREYLSYLSQMGIGRPSANKASGANERSLWEIAASKKSRILRSTERRILGISPSDALPRGAFVDGDLTRQQVGALLANHFTKAGLAARFKRSNNRFRVLEGDKVRATSALRINSLYRLMLADQERNETFYDAA